MQWTNSVERYGTIARFFHWTIAILILMMLVMGWKMQSIPPGADKFWVYSLHKSIGVTILFLALGRLAWKLANWNLPRDLNHPKHEHWLATFVHWGFYALMIGMPLTGWLLTSAANSTINWFGFFPVPKIAEPDPALRDAMRGAHGTIATIIWAFIALHVAGVIKHMVIDKDSTLRRMFPFMTPALVLFLLASPAHGAGEAPFPSWTIDRAASTLKIQATQEGSAFDGQFKAFDGKITLDPEHPEKGSATITVDLASFDSKNTERDEAVKTAAWFDVPTMPTATYAISKFEKSGKKTPDGYLATGVLRLRGLEHPIDLPFTMTITEKDGIKTAHCVGSTTLKRLDFGVGDGQWADPGMVGDAVIVKVDLTMRAHKAP